MKRFLVELWKAVWIAATLLVAVQIVIAVLGLPPPLVTWMTVGGATLDVPPRFVVVLGGAGIPSESGLIRTYYAGTYGATASNATFVVCLPTDGDPDRSSVGRMRDELVLRGVPREAVLMEYQGRNTIEQAQGVARLLGAGALDAPVMVVTSPYHGRRSLMCFRKAGFTRVGVLPAFSAGADAQLGPHTGARYDVWGNLDLAVWYGRELAAIAYYVLRGWL
jgi:uncharacterized SAM-binding protein YcdF (DUF218 family)